MKWKLDENGKIVVDEKGNPILVNDAGVEAPFDPIENRENITKLNRENASHRTKANDYKAIIDGYGEITPEQARDAISKVDILDKNQSTEIKQVEEGYKKLLAEKEAAWTAERDAADRKLKTALIGNQFSTSNFISEKSTHTAKAMQALFGDHFDVNEDGQVVYLQVKGDPETVLRSAANPAKPADFEEGLLHILSLQPDKDLYFKSTDSAGAGGRGGGSGVSGGGKKRSEMTAKEKAEFVTKNGSDAYLNLPE